MLCREIGSPGMARDSAADGTVRACVIEHPRPIIKECPHVIWQGKPQFNVSPTQTPSAA